MRRTISLTVLATLACGVLQASAADSNLAVINLAEVFEKYDMTADLETRFDQMRRDLSMEAEQRRDRIEQGRRALSGFQPGSEDYSRRENELMRSEADFQVWTSYEEKRLKDEHKRWLLQIYGNTRTVIGEIAKERNIDLVLTYDDQTEQAPDSMTLRQQIMLQKVIFHSDRVDITAEVLKRLNDRYSSQGGAALLDSKLGAEKKDAGGATGGQNK